MRQEVRKKITSFPNQPGCYLMKNEDEKVLYVGKAKDLRKRVSSYWRARDVKTFALVQEIRDIEYIVTNSEVEALILEAQLIQQHHPKYNIDLQSPGRYAFIKITNEEYPRLLIARRLEKNGTFIGPYTCASARNEAVRSAYRIFRLCKLRTKKGKPCFRYHLGYCSGACAGIISLHEYQSTIRQVKKFLRGNFISLVKETKAQMDRAASKEQFEKAKVYRDRLLALEKLNKQEVSRSKHYDQDVVNGIFSQNSARIQIFHFHRGIISGRKEFTFDLTTIQRSEPEEIIFDFLSLYYRSHDVPREIIVPMRLGEQQTLEKLLENLSGQKVSLIVPQKGQNKKLLDLVKKNLLSVHGHDEGQLVELQEALHLSSMPVRIACVDISTLSGTNTVGSLIQFVNGQPWKGGYRKFRIKNVTGVNDYAAIEELVSRFGARVLEEKEAAPDLLMIDGGKGQLRSAQKSLRALNLAIPTIALAKRLEEIYIVGSPYPLHLSARSTALQLLRAIRDEAHRFAITYQKKRRKYGK